MAVLQPTHLPVRTLVRDLTLTTPHDRNRLLATWVLDYTRLPYTAITIDSDAARISVRDLDDLEAWLVELPALGIDHIIITVSAETVMDDYQVWVVTATVPNYRQGREARLRVAALVPLLDTAPVVLQDALAEAVAA